MLLGLGPGFAEGALPDFLVLVLKIASASPLTPFFISLDSFGGFFVFYFLALASLIGAAVSDANGFSFYI